MLASKSKTVWCCRGKSVLGAAHQRAGLPNQDAIGWWPESGAGLPLLLAVADGHGSTKSFRSHLGAAQAVQVAREVIGELFNVNQPLARSADLQKLQHLAQERLPQELVQRWQKRIHQEFKQHPFTEAEWLQLRAKGGEADCQLVTAQPLLAYGATLLAVLVTQQFVLYLQLGDGDILSVDVQGRTWRALPKDPDLLGNETTSLCQNQAWESLRVRLVPFTSESPDLILLTTDGYANSFVSDADFCRIGPDYLQMIQEQGMEAVAEQLEPILLETSQQGSGDDITLGMIKLFAPPTRPATLSQPPTLPPRSPKTQLAAPSTPSPAPLAKTIMKTPANSNVQESSRSLSAPTGSTVNANQQLRQTVRQLQMGIAIALGTSLLSLGLAGFSLWLALKPKPEPVQKIHPSPMGPLLPNLGTPASSAPGRPQLEGLTPTHSPEKIPGSTPTVSPNSASPSEEGSIPRRGP